MKTINWAEWLSAIGTIGAFGVSLFLLWMQQRDNQKISREKDSTQARQISVWIGESKSSSKYKKLWVQNLSEEPIYHLVARYGKMGVDFNKLPATNNNYIDLVWGNLPPKAKESETISAEFVSGDYFPDIPSVEIEFTDANSKHWRRNAMGNIENIRFRKPID